MSADEMDRWFVHTNAYLEAVDEPPPEVERTARFWPRLLAGVALGAVAFGVIVYVL